MEFNQQIEKIKQLNEKFKSETTKLLNEVTNLDAIAKENKIDAFTDELILEMDTNTKSEYDCFRDDRYSYLFNRMNDENQIKQRLDQMVIEYVKARILIANSWHEQIYRLFRLPRLQGLYRKKHTGVSVRNNEQQL